MKYIVPQDSRISVGINLNLQKARVKDFISKHPDLSEKPYAEGSVRGIDFRDYDDFVKGLGRLSKGENLVLIGSGPNNFSLIVYKK